MLEVALKHGYSAHAGQTELVYFATVRVGRARVVLPVHGDKKASDCSFTTRKVERNSDRSLAIFALPCLALPCLACV
ncbi:MBL fold metallo-hydrolase RNA specificity domain-containing protein [Pseudomonas sp. R9(2017)]|uniref:MBL fold metallo-hydrolase RNA specificity domain-containing protein n=1 Tax=unclassified Pseudomonas TaxID=196821 RepID=UPI003530903F